MNDIQAFNFREREVRVHVDDQGNPWWIAKDVCAVLGLDNNRQALERLNDTQKTDVTINDTSSKGFQQRRSFLAVNEPGLYKLIFTSRKPEAEAFQDWVYTDVLPAIRKTGTYSTKDSSVDIASITRANLATMVLQAENELAEAREKNKKLQPAADYATNVLNEHPGASMLIGTFAKSFDCGLGPLQIFRWLRDTGIFFIRNNENLPKQEYIDRGYFALKQQVIPTKKDGIVKDRHVCTVLISTKGQIWLATKLRLAGYTKHQAALALN